MFRLMSKMVNCQVRLCVIHISHRTPSNGFRFNGKRTKNKEALFEIKSHRIILQFPSRYTKCSYLLFTESSRYAVISIFSFLCCVVLCNCNNFVQKLPHTMQKFKMTDIVQKWENNNNFYRYLFAIVYYTSREIQNYLKINITFGKQKHWQIKKIWATNSFEYASVTNIHLLHISKKKTGK